MYRVIERRRDKENGIEARLAKIDQGYSVGTWDLEEEEYYPTLRIFPYTLEGALGKARAYFDEYVSTA